MTTNTEHPASDGSIRPTYYVRHLDGSYSVAEPQPTADEIAAQQHFVYALCDGQHGGGTCSDPYCYVRPA
jgi:hypothetical protein